MKVIDRQLGDACNYGSSDRNICDPSVVCDITSTCVARPVLGEACEDDNWCGSGTTCSDGSGGTCIPRTGVGAACETSFDDPAGSNCEEALYCDTSESPAICTPRVALRMPCDSSNECVSHTCVDGRCLARAECVLPGTL